jgi:hypothetical protein
MNEHPTELYLFEPERSVSFEEDLPPDPVSESQARSSMSGKEFDAEAEQFLIEAGGRILERNLRVLGFPMDFLVEGTNGRRYYVDGHGTPDRTNRSQAGMRRTDTIRKFGFNALCLAREGCPYPIILLTSHMPREGSEAEFCLSKLTDAIWDAMAIVGDPAALERLRAYLNDESAPDAPLPALWRAGVQQGLLFDPDPLWDDDDA